MARNWLLLYFLLMAPFCLASSSIQRLNNPISLSSNKLVMKYRSGEVDGQNFHSSDYNDGLIEDKPDYDDTPNTPLSRTCRICRQVGREVVSGAIAGLASELVLYPLDTIKTRLQTLGLKNVLNGLTVNELYSGIKPSLMASIPSSASFFLTYNTLKHLTQSAIQPTSPYSLALVHMLSSAGGSAISSLTRTPFEILKQKAQINSPLKGIKDIKYPELLQGWKALLYRDVLFDGLQMPIYELMRSSLKYNNVPEGIATSAAGLIAGASASVITTPIDVIKSQIMTSTSSSKDNNLVSSIVSQVQSIYKKEGVSGLFAGVLPRMVTLGLGGSIYFGTYDYMYHLLGGQHD